MVVLHKFDFETGALPPEATIEVSPGNVIEVVPLNPLTGAYSCHVNNLVAGRSTLRTTIPPNPLIFTQLGIRIAADVPEGTDFRTISFIHYTGVWYVLCQLGLIRTETGWTLELDIYSGDEARRRSITAPIPVTIGTYNILQLGFVNSPTGGFYGYFNGELVVYFEADTTDMLTIESVWTGISWGDPVEFHMDDVTIATEVIGPPAPVTHSVVISSSPIIGVPITVDGSAVGDTPLTISLTEGPHTIGVPSEVIG